MRKLAIFCASFACAVFAAHYGPDFSFLTAAAAFGAAFALSFLLRGGVRTAAACITLGLALGFLHVHTYTALVCSPMTALSETEQTVTMELCDYPRETAYGAKATVRILSPTLRGKAVYYGEETLLALAPGARLRDTVTCADASRIRDTEVDTFTSRGEFLLLYGSEDAVVEQESAGVRYLPQRLARQMKETLDEIFPARSAAFMRSLLMGDKSSLGAADETALSEAGLFHITAVSGLHCAFLLLLITRLFTMINRRFLGFAAIPILVFYALMTGGSPSVVRACIMLSMMLIAPLFYRERDLLTSLAFALLLILLANPFAIASVSLQLSFASLLGILLLTPKLDAAIKHLSCGKALRFILRSFSVTAGALLFALPLCAYYFGVASLVSPLANLLCLSVTSLVFGLGMAATVIGLFFAPLGSLLAGVAHYGVLYILETARLLTKIPHHALYFENAALWLWLAYVYVLFLGCYLLRRGRLRYPLAALCAAAALAVTVGLYQQSFAAARANIVIADVGQGQSIVLMSGEECAVIDCGSSNYASVAGNLPADILRNAGYGKLDRLFITHYDADHVNGAETLFSRIEVAQIVLPPMTIYDARTRELVRLASKNGTKITFISDEESECFSVGELTVHSYPPLGGESSNERGVSYLAALEAFDFLVTGDINRASEKMLVKEYALPDVEVLVAGHHGAKSSTQRELLDAVTPEVGVVSVGSNSYGHPTNEALYRMTDRDMAVYRTDYQGNIYIKVN